MDFSLTTPRLKTCFFTILCSLFLAHCSQYPQQPLIKMQDQNTKKELFKASYHGSSSHKNQTYYFSFGQSTLRPDIKEALKPHILYLLNHPQARACLEGHTDERGPREYNLELGRSRTQAIANEFKKYGVPSTQLDLISYGEEHPAVLGHSEQAWKKNRRVHLIHQCS